MDGCHRFTREPLATYESCVWRLVASWDDAFEVTEPGRRLPLEAEIICDLFWVTDAQLRADVRRCWTEIMGGRHSRFKPRHARHAVR